MKLTLKIYSGKKVEKTYEVETVDFSFGLIEDVLDVLDFEHMESKADIGVMIVKASKQLKPFLKEIFDGVTDEEIRHTHIQNLIEVFRGLYHYAEVELGSAVSGGEKT